MSTIEVRGGIQHLVEKLERYEHPSEWERLCEEQAALRRDVERIKLRSNLTRIQPFVFGQERADLQAAVTVLDAGGFNTRAVGRMLSVTAEKIKTLPAQARSIEFAAQTRAAGARVVSFLASTDTLDRAGTVIRPMGIDTTRYETNPIVAYGHAVYGGMFSNPDPANVLGKTLRLRKSEHRLEADVEFLPASVNPRAEMVFQMLQRSALNAVSIGFIPRDVVMEMINGHEIPCIRTCELLEISVVPIPAQSDATATSRN